MSNLAVINNTGKFDFETNAVEMITLPTLIRTHQENNIYGDPISGIRHYEVVQRALQTCKNHGLSCEIETVFAAQNKNKTQPGVSLLPKVEEIHGEKAVEAHILRRVFTTIKISDGETEELTTTLAIACHQDGIQFGIGPCVKICHNQCILSSERIVSNYGKTKVTTEGLFVALDGWLSEFHGQMKEDRTRIQLMKNRVLTEAEILQTIGLLQVTRVAHDCRDKEISAQAKSYPLNQGQISVFTEELLKKQKSQREITVWDIYNVATEIYKPGRTDVPVIINQNLTISELLHSQWVA